MKRVNRRDSDPPAGKIIDTIGNKKTGNASVRPAKLRSKRLRRLLLVALVCAVVWPVFAWAGAELFIVKSDLPRADAIVVLSGSSTYIERADWAAQQYRAGRAPVVILTDDKLISGWNRVEERNPFFYELAAKELQERGVPSERIQVIPEAVRGTYDESQNICEYARVHQLTKVLIVTSGYHSRRALWSIRHACPGYEIQTGVDGPPPGWQTPSPWTWWLHRWGWRVVAGEYVKMVYYWLKY